MSSNAAAIAAATATAAAAAAAPKAIRLQKSADWPIWLAFVRMLAEGEKVWDLVNPDLESKPANLEEPVEPVFNVGSGTIDESLYRQHKIRMQLYQNAMTPYKRQQDSLNMLIRHIQSTISSEIAVYLQHEKSHPYTLLRVLKLRIAPTDHARKREIEQKYRDLSKRPASQHIDKWLDSWKEIYTVGKALRVSEMTDERPVRDFIFAAMKIDKAWGTSQLSILDAPIPDDTLFNLISKFRNYMRMIDAANLEDDTHSAFSASTQPQNRDENNRGRGRGQGRRGGGGLSWRGQGQQRGCLCGMSHYWSDCPYLNPSKRPTGWKSDSEIAKRVDEAMQNSNTKQQVETSIKRRKEFLNQQKFELQGSEPSKSTAFIANDSPDANDLKTSTYSGVFTVATDSELATFSVTEFPLLSSWILDNGSDINICNRTMLHRFRKTRDAPKSRIVTGKWKLEVEAIGEIEIHMPAPDGGDYTVLLKEVSYIPDFMTNIVSQYYFRDNWIFIDESRMRLHCEGKTLAWIQRLHGKDVLEDHTVDHINGYVPQLISSSHAASKVPSKSATAVDWHHLLAHASDEVIRNLPAAAEGVKMTDDINVPKTHECEACALAKMHQIISRSHDKEENSPTNAPFFRVSYDLIAMSTGLNGHKWVSHLACTTHDFNIVYTHRTKGEASEIIRQGINLIRTRFNGKIVFFPKRRRKITRR